jgi:parallel beta-helix repeat protein
LPTLDGAIANLNLRIIRTKFKRSRGFHQVTPLKTIPITLGERSFWGILCKSGSRPRREIVNLETVAFQISQNIKRLMLGMRARETTDSGFGSIEAIELESRILYSASPIPVDAVEFSEGPAFEIDQDSPDDLMVAPDTAIDLFTQPDGFFNPTSLGPDADLQDIADVVFVDAGVANLDLIVSDLSREPTVEVIVLESDQDGMVQITQALSYRSSLSAVHIVSHGSTGQIQLGSTTLTNENLGAYAGQIANWADAMDVDADLLFYGCNLAADQDGQSLVEAIGELTQTDVAASVDLTGHNSLGGDWDLEFIHGDVNTQALQSRAFQEAWISVLASPITDGTGAFWFTTASSANAGGLSFDETQITQIGGSNLQLEPGGTSGTFEATGFTSTETIRALHVVQSTTLVGDTTVQRGDLLLAFGTTGSVGGVSVAPNDVLHFRPDTEGDYSSGTYSMFLEGLTGGANLNALALVESNVSVGGFALNAGTILFAQAGTQDEDVFFAQINQTSFGPSTVTGIAVSQELVVGRGSSTNLTFSGIEGLSIVESQTTIGDRTFSEGTILVSIDLNTSTDIGGGATARGQDIVALDISQAEPFGGTAATSSVVFDGSDVQLSTSGERIHALSLINPTGSITVDTTADVADGDTSSITALINDRGLDGKISLREAITAANNTANSGTNPNAIYFDIPETDAGRYYYQDDGIAGSLSNIVSTTLSDSAITDFDPDYPYSQHSWFRIDLDNNLPQLSITDAVVIDGYSQSGATENTAAAGQNAALRIELTNREVNNNQGGPDFKTGLIFTATADGSTLRGLAINQFGSFAVRLDEAADNIRIEGNFIGTDITGTVDIGNDASGIEVRSNNNTIGGSDIANRNVISGNDYRGVSFSSTSLVTNNVVENNYIGVDATGMNSLANRFFGIELSDVDGITITNNIVSGNEFDGIRFIDGGEVYNATIQSNLIGVAADGQTIIQNGGSGIRIASDIASSNLIGGTSPGEGNIISGNAFHGIALDGLSVTANSIFGNFVGTDQTASMTLGNLGDGIQVTLGGSNNVIGGINAGQANVIAYNDQSGVSLNGLGVGSGTGNQIRGNEIFANTELGIDLLGDGITANDDTPTPDMDNGPNRLQNTPVINSAIFDGSEVTLNGEISGEPLVAHAIDFYVSQTADGSGHGEAETYVGSATVTTDSLGHSSFTVSFTPPYTIVGGEAFTATTTHTDGSTSEFAQNSVLTNQAPTFTFTPTLTQIAENTNTNAAIKVGDIFVHDDGLGTNDLTIEGTDKAKFSIVGNEVFLNANTVLNHEAQDQFDIRFELDDPSIGTTTEQEEAFAFSILDINEAPVFVDNSLTVQRGETVTLGSGDLQATDVDSGDPNPGLQFTVSNVTNGQFELISAAGTAITSFTQAQVNAGQIVFVHDDSTNAPSYEVEVTDGGIVIGPQSAAITFQNNFSPTATLIGDLIVNEDSSDRFLNLNAVFDDIEDSDSDLTYTIESSTNPSLFDSVVIHSNGFLQLDFAQDQNGTANMVIRATDTTGHHVDANSLINVQPVNDDPFAQGTIPGVHALEDANDTSLSVSPYFDDVDIATNGDTLTYSLGSNTNSILVSATIVGDQVILNYAENQFGSAVIQVFATDGHGQTALQEIVVSVTPQNDIPFVANPIVTLVVDEDAPDSTINLLGVFNDIEDTTLAYSLVSNDNTNLLTANVSGNDLVLNYISQQNGVANVIVRATDSEGAFVDHAIEVTVNSINDAPTVDNPLGPLVVEEDPPNSIVNLLNSFTDIEDTTLSYTIVNNDNPSLLSTNIVGNDLVLVYSDDGYGTAEITVRAEDSEGSSVDQVLTVDVTPVNDLPTVVNQNYQSQNSEEVEGNLLDQSVDIDGDVLNAQLVDGPSNGTISLQSDGTFTYTPNPGFMGTDSFSFIATDGTGNSVIATGTIEVDAALLPPDNSNSQNNDDENNVVAPEDVALPPQAKLADTDNSADDRPTKSFQTRIDQPYSPEPPQATNPAVVLAPNVNSAMTTLPTFAAAAEFTPTLTTETVLSSTSNLSFAPELLSSLAAFGNEIDEATNAINYAFVNSIVSFSGFSLIGATWFLRGGALLASMMANVPAWRIIDPLVVLRYAHEEDEYHESLHDIVEGQPAKEN